MPVLLGSDNQPGLTVYVFIACFGKFEIVFDKNNTYASKFGTGSFPRLTVVTPGGDVVYAGDNVPEKIGRIIESGTRYGSDCAHGLALAVM